MRRVEVILLCDREGYSHRDVSYKYNRRRYSGRQPIGPSTLGRLLKTFTATGCAAEKPQTD